MLDPLDILEKTPLQLLGDNLIRMGANQIKSEANLYINIWKLIWENPNGYTAQQVFDNIGENGTGAALFLQHASHAKAKILACRPSLLPEQYRDTPFKNPANEAAGRYDFAPELDENNQPTGRILVV